MENLCEEYLLELMGRDCSTTCAYKHTHARSHTHAHPPTPGRFQRSSLLYIQHKIKINFVGFCGDVIC